MSDLLLGVDLGTTRIKAVLLDAAGTEHGSAAVPTPFHTGPDGVEMTVADLERALGGLFAALPDEERRRVAAAGLAGMAESGLPLAGGEAAGPIVAWFDGRGEETVARLTTRFGGGLSSRIGQRLRTVSSVAKLGWLLDHGLARARRWLGVPETALFLLTGMEVTEHSLAARTGAYDVARLEWIPEVIELLGLPGDVFPEIRPAGTAMAMVSAAGGRWSALPGGVPVTIAGHDHLAGAEAVGAGLPDLLNSVGTAETLLRRSAELPDIGRALELGLSVTVRPGGCGWVALASGARSGQVLEALSDELGLPPEELDRRLEQGQPPGVVWEEALERLAARAMAAGDRLDALLGPAARLIVYGGGSRSRPWLQIKASLAPPGLPVLRSGATEAAARGAALAAGVAAGWWPSVPAAPPPPLEPVATPG